MAREYLGRQPIGYQRCIQYKGKRDNYIIWRVGLLTSSSGALIQKKEHVNKISHPRSSAKTTCLDGVVTEINIRSLIISTNTICLKTIPTKAKVI